MVIDNHTLPYYNLATSKLLNQIISYNEQLNQDI